MPPRPHRTAASLIAAALLLAATLPLGAAPPPSIRAAVRLVVLRNPASGEAQPIGTAFHIGGGWFRSAAHVVTATLPRRFEGKGLEQWALIEADEFGNPSQVAGPFETVCVDPRWKGRDENGVFPHDSALLRQTAGSVPRAALQRAERPPAAGDAVSVWGFPEGRVLFESRATVLGMADSWVVIQNHSGSPTVGGHSGSPVLDRREGVVGILSGGGPGIVARQRAVTIWDAEAGCPRPN